LRRAALPGLANSDVTAARQAGREFGWPLTEGTADEAA